MGASLLLSVATTYGIAKLLPPPPDGVTLILQWLILSVLATSLLLGIQALLRRWLPLRSLASLRRFLGRPAARWRRSPAPGAAIELDERLDATLVAGAQEDEAAAESAVLEILGDLNTHDRRTVRHGERVRRLSQLIAEQMGVSPADRERLGWAALLHDVGKLDVPRRLLAADRRDDEAAETVRTHPQLGDRLVRPLQDWLGPWADAVGHHHERWDGTGYPDGRAGTEISLAARIVAVADAQDAMTVDASRRERRTVVEAGTALAAAAGSQFDPAVVRAYLALDLRRVRACAGPLGWFGAVPVVGPLPALPTLAGVVGSGVIAVAALTGVGGVEAPSARGPLSESGLPADVAPTVATAESVDEDGSAAVDVAEPTLPDPPPVGPAVPELPELPEPPAPTLPSIGPPAPLPPVAPTVPALPLPPSPAAPELPDVPVAPLGL